MKNRKIFQVRYVLSNESAFFSTLAKAKNFIKTEGPIIRRDYGEESDDDSDFEIEEYSLDSKTLA